MTEAKTKVEDVVKSFEVAFETTKAVAEIHALAAGDALDKLWRPECYAANTPPALKTAAHLVAGVLCSTHQKRELDTVWASFEHIFVVAIMETFRAECLEADRLGLDETAKEAFLHEKMAEKLTPIVEELNRFAEGIAQLRGRALFSVALVTRYAKAIDRGETVPEGGILAAGEFHVCPECSKGKGSPGVAGASTVH